MNDEVQRHDLSSPRRLRKDIEALLRTYDEVAQIWPIGVDSLWVQLADGREINITASFGGPSLLSARPPLRVKGPTPALISRRAALYYATNGHCFYCTRKLMPLPAKSTPLPRPSADLWPTIDHKLPRTRGGTDKRDNLVICCYACNTIKGSLTAEEFEAEVLWAIDNGVELEKTFSNYRAIFKTNEKARTARSSVG